MLLTIREYYDLSGHPLSSCELFSVDAEGRRALNESDNILNVDQIEMKIRLALIENLPKIIAESVKPMEQIDDIRIYQVEGLNGGTATAGGDGHGGGNISAGGNLADQMVNSALRYRSQAPLVDNLLRDIGLDGGDINGLTKQLTDSPTLSDKSTAEVKAEDTAKIMSDSNAA